MNDIQNFIEAWEASETVSEVASRLGRPEGSVRTTKWRLQKQGYQLKNIKKTETNRAKTALVGRANKRNEK